MRRLFLGAGLICVSAVTAGADILSARYTDPTSVYGHGVVPRGEYEAIEFRLKDGQVLSSPAGSSAVYEDTAPRLVDVTGDGVPEVLSVISYFDRGAALRVWDVVRNGATGTSQLQVLAETPAIGRRHRWLAVAGAADLDRDGSIEIAYVDRPHLAKTLRIWRLEGDELIQVAEKSGLTNHRIGETHITGGIRDCGDGPEIITADAAWARIIATRFSEGQLTSRDIGRFTGRQSVAAAMACRS
ncbi:VCBS repeat-containing protein [Shimia sp. SDUM112013]|uniref:FG-GAP repeat domain-containing protein n=1 Tax=Shimia sp. SDUM112013 TaxID=3136160 RepID=UPI0032EE961B